MFGVLPQLFKSALIHASQTAWEPHIDLNNNTIIMNTKNVLTGLFGLSLLFTGCKEKEDPVIPNEEELITTLIYTLISQNPIDTVVMRFQDLDGEGGNPPIIIGGALLANSTYNATVELLNEQENPAEDITQEVIAEAEDHQFFFTTEGGLEATVDYGDTDMDGNPLGVVTQITTGMVSNGQLRVILRHEPDKNADGVSDGDITNAGGETDIEVVFNVDIQ